MGHPEVSRIVSFTLQAIQRLIINSLALHAVFFILLFNSLTPMAFSQTYFQQEVNYTIHVKLDDVKNELFANETIEYINNSSSTLTEIWFHIWPNAYKDDNTAMAKQLLENGETSFYYSKPRNPFATIFPSLSSNTLKGMPVIL